MMFASDAAARASRAVETDRPVEPQHLLQNLAAVAVILHDHNSHAS